MPSHPKYYARTVTSVSLPDGQGNPIEHWRLTQYATTLNGVCAADEDATIDLPKSLYQDPIATAPGCYNDITRFRVEPLAPQYPIGTPLFELARQFNIHAERPSFANTLGWGEKWLSKSPREGIGKEWFFITPLGLLYQGQIVEKLDLAGCPRYEVQDVKLLAVVDPRVYQDPKLIFGPGSCP